MKIILLVEDDEELARTLQNGLTMEEDYQIHHVTSAEDALTEAKDRRYDLMIVDWMLPDMNGVEFIQRLRDEGYATAALMLTVRDSVEDRVAGLEAGADDYLTKPFSFDELRARVRALLRRPVEWTSLDVADVGPLTINTGTREASLHGTSLDLRKKEFDLLHLLAERTPQVVSRSVIAERVWGTEFVSDNAIDVTVSGLRNQLKAASEGETKVRIETVRGVGYRLRPEAEPEG